MRTSTAVSHFGGRAGIVRALAPKWSKAAVYKWGQIIPLIAALEIQRITRKKLRVDMSLYKHSGHANNNGADTGA